jgi:hypothetical protein
MGLAGYRPRGLFHVKHEPGRRLAAGRGCGRLVNEESRLALAPCLATDRHTAYAGKSRG